MGIMPTLVMERAVYLRELSDGLYLPLVYLVRWRQAGGGAGGAAGHRAVSQAGCMGSRPLLQAPST